MMSDLNPLFEPKISNIMSSVIQANAFRLDVEAYSVGTKIALHLGGEDAKIMADNLGVINKDQRDIARELILS